MKIRFLTLLVFTLISQFQLIGQNTISNQNNNFEIISVGEHGFCRDGDRFYYKLDVEVKNNTGLKLKRSKLCASINQLTQFRNCSSKIYDSIWKPQSVIKFEMFLQDYSYYGIDKTSFDRTPENILLNIKINAHNIDIDFDELVSKYDIKDDWRDFQKVLGLRDIEPGEKLKIIGPPKNKEQEDKKINTSGYYGNDKDYQFASRIAIIKPAPTYDCNEEGLVIVTIEVDRTGKVVKATAGTKGSTNNAPCLLESSKEAALQTHFEPQPNAPEHQIGTIRYRFSLSN